MKGEIGCAICGKIHGIFYGFPKDFPNEWKLCCSCRSLARHIITYGTEFAIMIFNSDRIKEIYELITLNG